MTKNHFEAAERLLDGFDGWDITDPDQRELSAIQLAEAQVHATLAVAGSVARGETFGYVIVGPHPEYEDQLQVWDGPIKWRDEAVRLLAEWKHPHHDPAPRLFRLVAEEASDG